jgi:hypothetical protein
MYQHRNPGKTWRDQKLVANQDIRKYIEIHSLDGMAPRRWLFYPQSAEQNNGENNAYSTFHG